MTNPTSPDPHSLPLWMQATAFLLSSALAVIQAFQFVRRPTLSVHVTRDIFLRLIDVGEALFCNAVLLASNGSVLVREVRPTLRRINNAGNKPRAQKQFPLLVIQHGEKVSGPTVEAEHKFFGSSPLQYLEESKPYRTVYVCVQGEYQDKQKKAISDFSSAVEAFRSKNESAPEEQAPELRRQFAEIIDSHFNTMAQLIQLESGDYQLDLSVEYECIGWRFFGSRRSASSKIQFSIDEQLLNRWKTDLKILLFTRGRQIISQQVQDVKYPQLEPLEIIESPETTN